MRASVPRAVSSSQATLFKKPSIPHIDLSAPVDQFRHARRNLAARRPA
ncbi:hypothetical protein C7S15_5794 [Burkholderia cepacia]|nr:hypothetical protein [Burkholderia cepacia]